MESSEVWFALIALCLILIVTVVGYLLYAGLLYKVDIGAGKPPIGKATIVYKYGRGPYRNCGQIFSEVSSVTSDYRCIGLFYDDPKQVPAEKLRWAVGAILSEGNDLPDQKVVDRFHEKGFHLFFLPAVTNAVRTTFPFRTTLSMFISIFKVYPLIGDYIKNNRLCAHPFIELYDDKLIYFMAPLAKQDEFYVHEAMVHGLQPEGAEEGDLSTIPEADKEADLPGAGDGENLPQADPRMSNEEEKLDLLSQPRDNVDASGDHKMTPVPVENSTTVWKNLEKNKEGPVVNKDRSVSGESSTYGENKENRDANIIKGSKGFPPVNPSSKGNQGPVLGATSQALPLRVPPSPAKSTFSDSSMLSSTTDGSSVGSFYTSQSELSYTSDSQLEYSDSDQDTEKEDLATDTSQSGH